MDDKTLNNVKMFLTEKISYQRKQKVGKEIYGTIDILERIAEQLRFKYNYYKTTITLEEFKCSKVKIEADSLILHCPGHCCGLSSGTPAIVLQPLLLKFLLLHHQATFRVLDIIRMFTSKIRPSLNMIDFKKTETGVIRCYTNTRFAANTLRDYGLLKFTRKEAYKTWVLSLQGFIVGSVLMETDEWKIIPEKDKKTEKVHSIIRNTWSEISEYENFVARLTKVCKPEMEIFSTYQQVLQVAHKKLEKYWGILNDETLNATEKKNAVATIVQEIEAIPKIEEFYSEFSIHMNIKDVIKPPVVVRTDQASLFDE
jgi:hypothetical protein